MVVKVAGVGRSFAGVAAYCLHDPREPGEPQPEMSERVEWTDTRNLPTSRGDRATAVMAATAEAAPDLKRLAGGSAAGRKLAKPVCHYSLNWAQDEEPGREEMTRAVDQSLKALGLEKHQALIVAHNDKAHRHVHVIVNRVDLETGKAAHVGQSRLRLSEWAGEYERRQGQIRCKRREINNERRELGAWVRDRVSLPTGRYRRERMSPHQAPREAIPDGRHSWEQQEGVIWRRAEERMHWERVQSQRKAALVKLGRRSGKKWAELYVQQRQQREQLAADGRGVFGRLRRWRQGGRIRELGAAIGGKKELLRRWQEELEKQHRQVRVTMGKAHGAEARGIEEAGGAAYRRRMEGSEERAEVAVLAGRWKEGGDRYRHGVTDTERRVEWLASEVRLEQVRKVEGEVAYQEQKRDRDKAWDPERWTHSPRPSPDQLRPRGPERDIGFER